MAILNVITKLPYTVCVDLLSQKIYKSVQEKDEHDRLEAEEKANKASYF